MDKLFVLVTMVLFGHSNRVVLVKVMIMKMISVLAVNVEANIVVQILINILFGLLLGIPINALAKQAEYLTLTAVFMKV